MIESVALTAIRALSYLLPAALLCRTPRRAGSKDRKAKANRRLMRVAAGIAAFASELVAQ